MIEAVKVFLEKMWCSRRRALHDVAGIICVNFVHITGAAVINA